MHAKAHCLKLPVGRVVMIACNENTYYITMPIRLGNASMLRLL